MKTNFKNISGFFRHQPMSGKMIGINSLKQNTTVLLMVFAIVILGGCKKFLSEELKGEFSTGTFYQNEVQATQALNGVYNAITFCSFNNAIWVFGDIASDDAVKGGNPGDQAEITYIMSSMLMPAMGLSVITGVFAMKPLPGPTM